MRLISGIVVAALVGVTSGILMAPDKGNKTRKKFSKDGDRFKKDFEKNFNTLLTNVNRSLKGKKRKKSLFTF